MIAAAIAVAHLSILGASDPVFRDGFDAAACGSGRLQRSDVTYADGTLNDVDLTLFENIWGRWSANDDPELFPATSTSPTLVDFDMTQYLAAKVTMKPFTYLELTGAFFYEDVVSNPHIDLSISTACGDFSLALGECVSLDVAPDTRGGVNWSFIAHEDTCLIDVDREYFINVRVTAPDTAANTCSGHICAIRVSSLVASP